MPTSESYGEQVAVGRPQYKVGRPTGPWVMVRGLSNAKREGAVKP